MKELIERLRSLEGMPDADVLMTEAADLIESQAKAIEEMREAGERWHNEFAKAFITQVSTGDGEYFITVKFRTMSQMHEAYDAMARLADLTRPGGQA